VLLKPPSSYFSGFAAEGATQVGLREHPRGRPEPWHPRCVGRRPRTLPAPLGRLLGSLAFTVDYMNVETMDYVNATPHHTGDYLNADTLGADMCCIEPCPSCRDAPCTRLERCSMCGSKNRGFEPLCLTDRSAWLQH
jgi:hypothetical protein